MRPETQILADEMDSVSKLVYHNASECGIIQFPAQISPQTPHFGSFIIFTKSPCFLNPYFVAVVMHQRLERERKGFWGSLGGI